MKKWITSFALFFLMLSFTNCNISNKTFRNADKWLPPDFNPREGILLVERLPVAPKEEARMEAYMAEKYPYKYKFVDEGTTTSHFGIYEDTTTYKFALRLTSHTHIEDGYVSQNSYKVVAYDYYFYNRATGRNYAATYKASSYASMTFKAVINTIVARYK